MGSTGRASRAANQVPGGRPAHPVAGPARQALRAPVTVRALRELAFCAIEGPLGLSVLAAVFALPALGLLATLLAGGGAGTAGGHPRGAVSAYGMVFVLLLLALLLVVPWGARRFGAVHRRLVAGLRLRSEHPGTGVLVLSQYIETRYATRLLAGSAAGIGYLLKDRVADVAEFAAALTRVAGGGTALDPEVVSQLVRSSSHAAGLATLTAREREVLALMAEGRSNAGIAAALVISAGAVEKHVASIFAKLGLPVNEADNRRVLAVLRYVGA